MEPLTVHPHTFRFQHFDTDGEGQAGESSSSAGDWDCFSHLLMG